MAAAKNNDPLSARPGRGQGHSLSKPPVVRLAKLRSLAVAGGAEGEIARETKQTSLAACAALMDSFLLTKSMAGSILEGTTAHQIHKLLVPCHLLSAPHCQTGYEPAGSVSAVMDPTPPTWKLCAMRLSGRVEFSHAR